MRINRFSNAEISAGERHSAVLKTNGDLYLFGSNGRGQLGRGNAISDKSNTLSYVTAISNVSKVSLGRFHSAYIDTSYRLYTFGQNSYGELGEGTITFREETPINVFDNIKDVSLGGLHTLMLSGSATDGSLYGFGYNLAKQINTTTSAAQLSPYLISTKVDSGKFSATTVESHYLHSTSGYTYLLNNDNNLAVLNYTTGTGGATSGVASGANTIAIQLHSFGTDKPVNAAIKYTVDGTDPVSGNFAYVLGSQEKSGTTGISNLFFLPETGLSPYSTGAGDLTLKYIAISTGDSVSDIGNSFSTTNIIERKTLSPQIKVTYYDDILDTQKAVSGYSATGFSDLFNRDLYAYVNFTNYDTDSSGALKFYENGVLQSTNRTSSTGIFGIATSDNTNTGELTFSGLASGYKVTGSDVTGIFERHQLFASTISTDTPSGTKHRPNGYTVKLENNASNPFDSTIRFTENGTEPNEYSTEYDGIGIKLTQAEDPGITYTIRHRVYKDGYVISPEGDSGVYTVIYAP